MKMKNLMSFMGLFVLFVAGGYAANFVVEVQFDNISSVVADVGGLWDAQTTYVISRAFNTSDFDFNKGLWIGENGSLISAQVTSIPEGATPMIHLTNMINSSIQFAINVSDSENLDLSKTYLVTEAMQIFELNNNGAWKDVCPTEGCTGELKLYRHQEYTNPGASTTLKIRVSVSMRDN